MRRASLAAVVIVVAAPAWGTEYFLSPMGNDMAQGTRAAPWLTFANAVPRLFAGDTLTLLPGDYTSLNSGAVIIRCGVTAQSGLPFAPITLRADVERTAWLDDRVGGAPLSLVGCSYWRVEGLRVSSVDLQGSTTPLVTITGSDHVELRRLVVSHPNRFGPMPAIMLQNSTNVLVEESELYEYAGPGLLFQDSNGCTARRCYFNSRGLADVDGGAVTRDPLRGDSAVELRGRSRGNLVENCISEGQDGFLMLPGPGEDQRVNRVLGSVATPIANGVLAAAGDNMTTGMPIGVTVQDFVSTQAGSWGVRFDSLRWARCSRCTTLQTIVGVGGDVGAYPGDGFYAVDIDHSLATPAASPLYGFWLTGQNHSSAVDVAASGFPFNFLAPNVVRPSTVQPALGSCELWVPDSSPLVGSGIGAEVLYRYENGTLTGSPLWTDAGQFTCGARVTGVTDVPDASCVDMGVRFHVNQGGCPFPSAPSPRDAGVTPGNTFYVSPSGNDASPGTFAAPWRTLTFALAQLQPGDTLELADGTYTQATTGLLGVDCQMLSSGRPDAPITVRSHSPRGALLQGDGVAQPIFITNCSDWRFLDLVAVGADAPAGAYDVVTLFSVARVTLKGLLIARSNRYMNGELVSLTRDTVDSVMDDCELYDYHRTGVALYVAHGNTLRRLYINGRDYPDIDGGYASSGPGGDDAVIIYDNGSGNRVEDSVFENGLGGIWLNSVNGITANRFSRNLMIGGELALGVDDLDPGQGHNVEGNVASDLLTLGTTTAFGTQGGRGNVCDHCTFVGAATPLNSAQAHNDFLIDSLIDAAGASVATDQSATATFHLGVVDLHGYGVLPDAGPGLFDEDLRDPCVLAPVPGRGSDGGNLGADLRALFTPTYVGCGLIVPGINDDDGGVCANVHRRLGVLACPLPPDAGSDAGIDGGKDAGTFDGGTSDAGTFDAGAPLNLRSYQLGCGCSASPGAAVWLLLIMRWRRRARPSNVRRT